MPKRSAGLLMFRRSGEEPEVLLVHPGGPFWAKKNEGAWTIPKGEPGATEDLLCAAQREFTEETGFAAVGMFYPLGSIRQGSGKIVSAWAFEGDCDPALLRSNLCEIEWPPRSRKMVEIPEVDRGAWFSLTEARIYLAEAQRPLLDRLTDLLRSSDQPSAQSPQTDFV
jgi:predicted NUDIX family NTP pyrophosphohydrolase